MFVPLQYLLNRAFLVKNTITFIANIVTIVTEKFHFLNAIIYNFELRNKTIILLKIFHFISTCLCYESEQGFVLGVKPGVYVDNSV